MDIRFRLMMLTFVGIFFIGANAVSQTRPMIFLPFAEDTAVYCTQGNNDTPTHNGDMAYAYDFTTGDPSTTPGTNLYAPFSGTVREVVRTSTATTGWGNTIVIQADSSAGGYRVRLAHLQVNTIPTALKVGTRVEQGQFIGKVGNTGKSTGAHLHIQMMSSGTSSRSIPFDFVEGPVDYGDWLVSDLQANRYVVDNRGRVSVGSPIGNISTSSSGTFRTYGWTDGTHGSDSRGSTSTGARFNWLFRLDLPTSMRSPRMTFWAHCPYSSGHDTGTTYTVTPSSGSTIRRVLNQRGFRWSNNFQSSIGSMTAAPLTRFTVTAARGSSRMCADSIVVDLAW